MGCSKVTIINSLTHIAQIGFHTSLQNENIIIIIKQFIKHY